MSYFGKISHTYPFIIFLQLLQNETGNSCRYSVVQPLIEKINWLIYVLARGYSILYCAFSHAVPRLVPSLLFRWKCPAKWINGEIYQATKRERRGEEAGTACHFIVVRAYTFFYEWKVTNLLFFIILCLFLHILQPEEDQLRNQLCFVNLLLALCGSA